jgi:hypothetical protein
MGKDGKPLKYEDDMCALRFPSMLITSSAGTFTYRFDRVSIEAPICPLRTPWHLTKTGVEFLECVVFLGVLWDLVQRRASLPSEKRAKYLARVCEMIVGIVASRKFTLVELQEIHGTLCHLCFLFTAGASRLPVFSNATKGFKGNAFAERWLPNSVLHSLRWWEARIADVSAFKQLRPLGPLRDFGIYVDASTSYGVAIVIGERWYSWELTPYWKSPGLDICWLESVAIELLLMFLVQLNFRDIHILIRSDNKGAIGAHTKGRSPNVGINLCARRSFAIAAGSEITPNIIYVASADNLADAPSRGLAAPHLHARGRLTREFDMPVEFDGVFLPDRSPV